MELKKEQIPTRELLEKAYAEMEQHRRIATAQHCANSETAMWHDACMRSIGEMTAKLVGMDPQVFLYQFEHQHRYIAPEEPGLVCLCENVFEISRIAECMEIERRISVPDSKALFHCILGWAREFEKNFDPESGEDYYLAMEGFATKRLEEKFPFDPELKERPVLLAHQAIIDYIRFEDSTAEIFPWAISAEEMLYDTQKLAEVQTSLFFYRESGYNTDDLHEALNEAFGVNPTLLPAGEQEMGL